MFINFQEIPGLGPNPFEGFTTATASTTKRLQAIMTETTEYSKKSFEKARVLAEKLAGVKKIDEAFQLQSDFAKSAFEDFVAQAMKIGNLYSDLAKEAFGAANLASPAQPPTAAPAPKAPVATKQS